MPILYPIGQRIRQPPDRLQRRVGARSPGTSRSLGVMRYVVGGYPAGGERSRPALNGKAHASAACCSLFRAVHPARDLAKQLRRLPVSVMLGAQSRDQQMRPAGLEAPASWHRRSVFSLVSVAEDRRFELLRGCPPTRFPIMLPGVHQRSPAFTTVRGLREHEHADAGERRRTGVNETKTETTVMELRPAGPCLRGLEPHALARNLSPKVQSSPVLSYSSHGRLRPVPGWHGIAAGLISGRWTAAPGFLSSLRAGRQGLSLIHI